MVISYRENIRSNTRSDYSLYIPCLGIANLKATIEYIS